MIIRHHRRGFRLIPFAVLLGASVCGLSVAQTPIETVQWDASVVPVGPVKYGSTAILELSAQVREGWHVYALTQPAGGPTALRITLDRNEVVRAAGAPSGTVPQREHDPSFDLETEYYTHAFALRLPVQVKRPAGGRQLIPISVRFQSCSDKECLPPRTVQLSIPIDVIPEVTLDRESPRT